MALGSCIGPLITTPFVSNLIAEQMPGGTLDSNLNKDSFEQLHGRTNDLPLDHVLVRRGAQHTPLSLLGASENVNNSETPSNAERLPSEKLSFEKETKDESNGKENSVKGSGEAQEASSSTSSTTNITMSTKAPQDTNRETPQQAIAGVKNKLKGISLNVWNSVSKKVLKKNPFSS